MTTARNNDVLLEGQVSGAPEWSHENHGTRFYRFFMEIPRLSGQADLLPVLLPEPMLAQAVPNAPLRVRGQLRSFNNRSGQGPRLVISVFVRELIPGGAAPFNQTQLSGILCKTDRLRKIFQHLCHKIAVIRCFSVMHQTTRLTTSGYYLCHCRIIL